MELEQQTLKKLVAAALAEDVGPGDVTSEALMPESVSAEAVFVSREAGVLAGMPVAAEVFCQASADVVFTPLMNDGDILEPGSRIAVVSGPARAVLMGERLALNFMQRLCGIATLTRKCVEAVAGYDCRILDTRKTTPGLRMLEKYAVTAGGGSNHRIGLYDQVLIKDNHLGALLPEAGDILSAVTLAVTRAREHVGGRMLVELEAENLAMVDAALKAGADIIMLDNMADGDMCAAAKSVRTKRAETGSGHPITEASGGLTLDRLKDVAATGVDTISLGMLTHSVSSLDIGLDMD
jgi:nicotinate-nucleotide pyrophosphorylase (carboxylating)